MKSIEEIISEWKNDKKEYPDVEAEFIRRLKVIQQDAFDAGIDEGKRQSLSALTKRKKK